MKTGIIADIHSNYEAFKSIAAEMENEDTGIVYSLGDVVGYGASPNECMEYLRKKKIISVLGNHDYCAVTDDDEFMNDLAREAIKYTRKELKEEYAKIISNWDYVRYIDKMLLFHGMPDEERVFDYILFKEDIIDVCEFINEKYPETVIAFFAHTHEKAGYEYDPKTKKIEIIEISYDWLSLREDRMYLFNPGSVGQPRDGDVFASGIVYDKNKHMIKYVKAQYDINKEAHKIKINGLPEFFAERLYKGI